MTTTKHLTHRHANHARTFTSIFAALLVAAMLSLVGFAADSSGEPAAHTASRDESASRTSASRCSARTIRGSYATNISGTFLLPPTEGSTAPPVGVPLASVGQLTFGSRGYVSGTDTNSFNGAISTYPVSGNYSVNDDCTGTLDVTLPNGFTITNNIRIAAGGDEIFLIQTNPGTIVTGTLKRQ